ncbi:type IA DNA topoisomerase [Cohnella abietis]|uniref:type IA DNA topoisomerase n=1 Tax=Cohnella abietis TaxID=2507935 RepID=UPI00102E72FF|nr:type IA DNA topoisomerase [Cohnella abietis]
MKTLVIAEKPDMGRNIASVIEPKAQNRRSYLEGDNYIITWAIGHLIGLAEPDLYDDKYKKWRFGDLPIIPDDFKLLPNPRTKDQLHVIEELAARSNALVNACDAGREGQHIFSLIVRHLHLKQPVKRLWISDLTAETIRKGFDQLKDNTEYENLTQAARVRSEADWLIGMNGSRAFTTKHNELLSVGRVQTPVLALIYDRQKQIEAFDSLKFYDITGLFAQQATNYRGIWQGERLTDPEKAEAIAAKVKGKTGVVASYDVKDTKEYPFKLYDLTLLQREANGKFSFSAKKTLDTAQALYEKHKVISYPRTNSNYVNEQNIPEMHKILDSMRSSPDYGDFVKDANKKLVHTNNKNVCNPAKVEDHHAIMPTMKKPQGLSPDERKLYDLIVKRFLSHFYPAAEYKVHTVMTEVEKESFRTTVKQLLSLGWKVIYADSTPTKTTKDNGKDKDDGGGSAEDEEQETDAPFEIDASLPVVCNDVEVKAKETQPPKHFTEGTLLKAMESAGKQIEDEELRDAMKDSGLGTPATRAATIERLKQVGYMDMQGKKIVITPKGRMAIELIRGAGVELLTSPEMTGQWERRLTEISRGQASADIFMGNVKKFTTLIIDKVNLQRPAAKNAFAKPEPPVKEAKGKRKPPGDGKDTGVGGATAPKKTRATSAKGASTKASSGTASSSSTTTADALPSATQPSIVGVCPRPGCGGQIFMGRKGYGCSNYKTGCGFVIWKESLDRTLTDTMVKALIEKGKTSKLKFGGKADEEAYEARIILKNEATGELVLERS